MSLAPRALLLALLVSVSLQAETRTLALYAGPVHGLDAETSSAMRAELQRLLAPADLDIVWKTPSERKSGEDFDLVAVASFDGSCSPFESQAAVSTATLAD